MGNITKYRENKKEIIKELQDIIEKRKEILINNSKLIFKVNMFTILEQCLQTSRSHLLTDLQL